MATRRTDGRQTTTSIKDLVGRNLQRARAEADLSQTELARAADIKDPQQISKWERGIYMPSTESLLALGKALHRDLAWFYTDHDEEPVAA
jgi:transcriptional regulator with XRE-family HTH domain